MEYEQLPYIISFQRSGSHWLHCALELATGKRRVFMPFGIAPPLQITFAPKEWEIRWVHAHGCPVRPTGKVIYLYRDPTDVLYSVYRVRLQSPIPPKSEDDFVTNVGRILQAHLVRWLLSEDKADHRVRYEEMAANSVGTVAKVAGWLGLRVIRDTAADEVTRERLARSRVEGFTAHFNADMLEPDYEEQRIAFRARNADRVRELVVSPDLEPFFPR